MGKARVFFHTQLGNTYDQHEFHRVHVPAQDEWNVPSPGAQEAILRLDEGNLIRRQAERFIANDKIALAIQIPPLILILRAKRARREFHASGWGVFTAPEIEFSRRIDGINFSHREMDGKPVDLVFGVENAANVSCRVLAREKLHIATITNEGSSVHNMETPMPRKHQHLK